MSNNPPPQHNNGTHDYDNWVLLLRQGCYSNSTSVFFQSKDNWKNVGGAFSGGDPETDNNYSILGTFIDNPDDYKQSSGTHQNKYHFALRYSSNREANQWIDNFDHDSHTSGWKVWFQTTNPNTTSGAITGYDSDDETYNNWNENDNTEQGWGGIAVGTDRATWDGTPNHNNWWWAIGTISDYGNGLPADNTTVRWGVELWINTHNTPAYAGSGSGNAVGPLDISLGITGWYDGYSYDNSNSKWTDKTGLGNDLSGTDITGTLTPSIYHTSAHLVSYRNNKKYMQKMFKYIAGNITSRFTFPTGFLADNSYTLFHVARRDPNGTDLNGRIFDGSGNNWYSGFNDASSGVTAHDLSYINTTDRKYGNNWVVSVDRPNYYRSIGYSDFSSGYYDISSGSRTDNASPSSVPQLTINNGSTTLSSCDWNVAEVFAYNKHLSGSEEDSLADYLKFKYLGTNQVSTGDPHIYQLTHDISAVDASNTQQMIKGLPPDISAQTNLIGWYIPESYNSDISGFWKDYSGYDNDLSNCGTSSEFVDKDSTYNWISYIKGSKGVLGDDGTSYSDASGFIFPENLLPTDGSYTIIHVSRRVKDASGNATGRIFDSASNKNFYSGFVGSKSGVALHSVDVSASG